ncbi:hypothetical protein [Vagococcus sp.]|uniref:hypothetical protein n=1 Tax=Vagococcus sp. TaxID=1933889 RepID=UPI003F9495CE
MEVFLKIRDAEEAVAQEKIQLTQELEDLKKNLNSKLSEMETSFAEEISSYQQQTTIDDEEKLAVQVAKNQKEIKNYKERLSQHYVLEKEQLKTEIKAEVGRIYGCF